MTNRREFLARAAMGGVMVAASAQADWMNGGGNRSETVGGSPKAARITGNRITSVIRRDETIIRYAGNGDNYHMSWSADDRQFVAVCDGYGFSDEPKNDYNSRLFTISGEPQSARFEDVPGYPDLMPDAKVRTPRYYGYGTLALNGCVYQFLSTYND